jgi:hypothetical protein
VKYLRVSLDMDKKLDWKVHLENRTVQSLHCILTVASCYGKDLSPKVVA